MKKTFSLALFGLFCSVPAAAYDFIDSVGEEVELGPAGGWVRLFPDEANNGWHFLWAAGGDFVRLPMTLDFQVEDRNRKSLAGRTDLVDHAITRCPSGGYLHVASANVESFNDSAYAFRYDDDFNLIASGTLEEAEPARRHNDLPVICTPELMATAFIGGNHRSTSLSIVSEDATQADLIDLPGDVPRTEGGSLRIDPDSGELIVIGRGGMNRSLEVAGLDSDYNVLWKESFQPLSDSSLKPYWPQALLKVKDHYILAFMGRDESAGWGSDWGNVFLAILDSDYQHLETIPVSNYSPPEGAQRPGLARRGTQLLLTMDRNVQPVLFEIRLNADAFGIEGGQEDTSGGWDTSSSGGGTGDGDGGGEGSGEGCSCGTVSGRTVSWLPLMFAVFLRRRRSTSLE